MKTFQTFLNFDRALEACSEEHQQYHASAIDFNADDYFKNIRLSKKMKKGDWIVAAGHLFFMVQHHQHHGILVLNKVNLFTQCIDDTPFYRANVFFGGVGRGYLGDLRLSIDRHPIKKDLRSLTAYYDWTDGENTSLPALGFESSIILTGCQVRNIIETGEDGYVEPASPIAPPWEGSNHG